MFIRNGQNRMHSSVRNVIKCWHARKSFSITYKTICPNLSDRWPVHSARDGLVTAVRWWRIVSLINRKRNEPPTFATNVAKRNFYQYPGTTERWIDTFLMKHWICILDLRLPVVWPLMWTLLTCCMARTSSATYVPSNLRVAAIYHTTWPHTSRKCEKSSARNATNGWKINCVCANTCCNIPPFDTHAPRAIIPHWIDNVCGITFASITPMANLTDATSVANRSNWKILCLITWSNTPAFESLPVHFARERLPRAATTTRIESECILWNWRPCNWNRRKTKGSTNTIRSFISFIADCSFFLFLENCGRAISVHHFTLDGMNEINCNEKLLFGRCEYSENH